jgi:hypothetical protein
MLETLERIAKILTGKRVSEIVEEAGEKKLAYYTIAFGDLDGIRYIPAFDRITEILPDDAYPYVLVELVSREPTERQGLKKITLSFDLAVFTPGASIASVFGYKGTRRGILDLEKDVRSQLYKHKTLKDASGVYAYGCAFGGTLYTVGTTEKGVPNGKRYANFTVSYWVPEENEETERKEYAKSRMG